MTVTGSVDPAKLGSILPHEHIMVDFGGAAVAGPHRYDADDVFAFSLPHLRSAKEAGLSTLIECTPAFLGRDVQLLKRLSLASGLRIITNTGYYGAGNDKYIPESAYQENAEQIAARWIAEWENGIDKTDIRPGFIKTAFDRGPPSAIDLKLFQAAALAHLKTGLPIATHTGGNLEAVAAQIAILKQNAIPPVSWIWVHAQNVESFEDLLPALEFGSWISLDGVRKKTLQKHIDLIVAAKTAGYLSQILVSHDAGWYRVGETDGGPDKFRDYSMVHETLLPRLKTAGLTTEQIQKLHTANPQRAFSISQKR